MINEGWTSVQHDPNGTAADLPPGWPAVALTTAGPRPEHGMRGTTAAELAKDPSVYDIRAWSADDECIEHRWVAGLGSSVVRVAAERFDGGVQCWWARREYLTTDGGTLRTREVLRAGLHGNVGLVDEIIEAAVPATGRS